jgi:hypothetical protein
MKVPRLLRHSYIPHYQIRITNASSTGLMSHYGPAEGLGRGRLTGQLPDDVVTDSEAVEMAEHLQVMLGEEWARFGRKGQVPEVEVVRVLWKGEGRDVEKDGDQCKLLLNSKAATGF